MAIAVVLAGCCILEAAYSGFSAARKKAYNKTHYKRKKA
jgi:hypothetical protein